LIAEYKIDIVSSLLLHLHSCWPFLAEIQVRR